MNFHNRPGLSRFVLPLFVCLSLCLSVAAFAVDGPHYVALRTRLHYDRRLTYATVQNNPAAYAGRVFELRGTVGGTAETADGISIMLSLANNNAVTLDIPKSANSLFQECSTPRLRVLVQVQEGGSGNVVPLKVLAVAHDSLVSAAEEQAIARAAAVQKATRQRQERTRIAYASPPRSRGETSSRGGYVRYLPSTPDVQTMLTAIRSNLGPRAQPLVPAYLNFIMTENSRLDLPTAGRITYSLLNFADQYNVDPRLVVAMIIAESDFNPNSTSRTGAMGLGQLMPGTARELGVNNAYDPMENLRGSISYLRSRLDTFADKAAPGGGMSFEQVALAMAAYNAGTNAVKKYNGVPPYRETQAYVRRVTSLYQRLCGG